MRADPTVLREPPGDLVVRVGAASRSIDEILLITEPEADDHAVGMIRLARGIDHVPTVALDRAAVTGAWRDRRPLWPTLRDLGVLPAEWPKPTDPNEDAADRPAAIAVKSVAASPADWCTIFWWLC